MKALEQPTNSDSTFIIQDNEKSIISHNVQNRAKNRILEHVKNGTDVILVTSAKNDTDPVSLESYFSDSSDEIRTICLNSHSFVSNEDQEIDLSMISAVVYESIHLDTHFAIIVDNADQIPIQAINELIKLALGINSSKNNVNFIFSGGPGLLGTIERVSDITRLSLAHCSVDVITEEDIQEFIDIKQRDFDNDVKLHCNKFALKKISSLANGSLYNASVILEWIRLYSQHTNKFKITVGFLDSLQSSLENTNLLSNYPPHSYQFNTEYSPTDSQNIEFLKPDELIEHSTQEIPDTNTVYIDRDTKELEDNIQAPTIFEQVLDKSDSNENSEPLDNQDSKIEELEVVEELVAVDVDPKKEYTDESNIEAEYNDTYHIDALDQINDPLSPVDEDLQIRVPPTYEPEKNTSPNKPKSNRLFISLLFLSTIIAAAYFAWKTDLINSHYISSILTSKHIESSSTSNGITQYGETTALTLAPIDNTSVNNITVPIESDITALIEFAHLQIENKKLTTPEGDNAFETFQSVLEIEPNNREALSGIEKIKNRYTAWAKLDIKDNNIKRAKYFLSRAIEVNSEDKEVKSLLSSLETL